MMDKDGNVQVNRETIRSVGIENVFGVNGNRKLHTLR